MFADTTGAEVVDHGLECREWRAAVGPDLSAVGFLLSWSQHLYRCFIGVDYALGQHCFAQRIDQRLKLHAGLTHPLRQCRARDTDAIMHQHFHTVGPAVGKRSAQCASPHRIPRPLWPMRSPCRHAILHFRHLGLPIGIWYQPYPCSRQFASIGLSLLSHGISWRDLNDWRSRVGRGRCTCC